MSNFSLIPDQYMDSKKSPFLRKGGVSHPQSHSVWRCRELVVLMRLLCCVFLSGVAGDWKNHFSSEQLVKFSSVIKKELENEYLSLPWSFD